MSFSPNGSSLSVKPIRALIRPGRGSFFEGRKETLRLKVTVPFLILQPKPLHIQNSSCNLFTWFLVGTLGMTLTTVPSNCSMLISSKMTVPWGSSLTSVATSLPYGHKNNTRKYYIHTNVRLVSKKLHTSTLVKYGSIQSSRYSITRCLHFCL